VAHRCFDQVKSQDLLDEVVQIAEAARKGGLLSLEDRKFSNEFLGGGGQLRVDGRANMIALPVADQLTLRRVEEGRVK